MNAKQRDFLQGLVDRYGPPVGDLRWNREQTDIEHPPRTLPPDHPTSKQLIDYANKISKP